MLGLFHAADRFIWKFFTAACSVLMFLTVTFTAYTIVMRYVFHNPPAWGDTMSVFANIWLVFLALPLTVREKEHIALSLLANMVSLRTSFIIQSIWTLLISGVGFFLLIVGWENAITSVGRYWELFYMPKTYPLMILPISGFFCAWGGIASMIEDWERYKAGTFQPVGATLA